MSEENTNTEETATLKGGTYEVIRKRLDSQVEDLNTRLDQLNGRRKEIFGAVSHALIGNERVSTANNCVASDFIAVGDRFILGYNVNIGLKTETSLEDVFAVFHFEDGRFVKDELDLINDEGFVRVFKELYKYYKKARFVKFFESGPNLYMVFRTGDSLDEIKVFKWQILDGKLTYLDDRSRDEYKFPSQHEFEWIRTTRDMFVDGDHPHVSIEDRVFVETVGGDLTVKVEDNTADGSGIYAELVEEKDQTLDDAQIYYTIIGNIILMKILPYREKEWRYLVFNEKLNSVVRIDEIADSCILLPDDHGIIFSNGYYLQNGDYKIFANGIEDMLFERRITSPNGEDFLYVFYNRLDGVYILLSYNIIAQQVATPIICHGFSIFDDGRMIYFKGDEEPKKHHTIQIWQTPFLGANFEQDIDPALENDFLYKLGNKELVRCMADCREVTNLLAKDDSYAGLYIDVVQKTGDIIDAFFWLSNDEAFKISEPLLDIKGTSSTAIDEYDKVVRNRKETLRRSEETFGKADVLLKKIPYLNFDNIGDFVDQLSSLRELRGETISLKDLQYADIPAIENLEERIQESSHTISQKCVTFLLEDSALDPYREEIKEHEAALDNLEKVSTGKELDEHIAKTASGLEMLIQTVSNLKIDDPTETTRIIDNISAIFTLINQIKGRLKNRIKDLMTVEGQAEFNAQLKLLNQAVTNYLDISNTPEETEDYFTRIMVQLEELESKFSEFDEFIPILAEKRDEISNAFEQKKLRLREERGKRSQALMSAAERILKGIGNRCKGFKEINEINSYFAADLMIDKIRDLISRLREINDSVKADDLESQLKNIKEDTIRQLRDKQDLFVEGENAVKFGRHLFSVNTQPFELTIIRKDGDMFFHLTGTKFFEKIADPELLETRPVWDMEAASENPDVYRAEYLAQSILQDSLEKNIEEAPEDLLALDKEGLIEFIRKYMAPRYDENYTKGIHDNDAAAILVALLNLHKSLDLLRYSPQVRRTALILWNDIEDEEEKEDLNNLLKNFGILAKIFPGKAPRTELIETLTEKLENLLYRSPQLDVENRNEVVLYLIHEMSRHNHFIISKEAGQLIHDFEAHLKKERFLVKLNDSLANFEHDLMNRYELVNEWLTAYSEEFPNQNTKDFINEAAAVWATNSFNTLHVVEAQIHQNLENMLGSHKLLQEGQYHLDFLDFSKRLHAFTSNTAPAFRKFNELKKTLSDDMREEMRLDEFKPRVLSSFVRNRLINEVYLPIIGDNLAKQMGTLGEDKRTDLMGMLLLVSPPGYGKTTIMEYISSCLGLVFMKINGPAIGHDVVSTDPADATNATAKQELEKLNLSFEMGDNVMIYLDDIQHLNPEFLQKFISLCDGQRKIEGVYKGKTRTYDFRGRKVCVIMAGNPYTESGDKFQIPDMLSNRADTYNLGDVVGDTADAFNSSYVENALTSNPVLNKLATKSQKDIYALMKAAAHPDTVQPELEGSYSAAEISEITNVLKKLLVVRDAISAVNQEYIKSAATQDDYRVEPAFKLQGSYRNMNKITEKVLPVMNDEELRDLVLTHYENESQTLTGDAEFNLLKFKELFGALSEEDTKRIKAIRDTFGNNQMLTNVDENNPLAPVVAQLGIFGKNLQDIRDGIENAATAKGDQTVNLGNDTIEALAALRPQEVEKPLENILHFDPKTLEALTKSLANIQPVAPAKRVTNPDAPKGYEMLPGELKIVNTVPDFFAHILQEQLDLMKTWLDPLLKQTQENNASTTALKSNLKGLSENFEALLNHVKKD